MQHIIAVTAIDRVIAAAGINRVIARAGRDDIGPLIAEQAVIAAAAAGPASTSSRGPKG